MKKIIASLLVVCISISAFWIDVFATRYDDCEESLEELSMFKGVGVDKYRCTTFYL